MKETGSLRVKSFFNLPEHRLNIHPNEGSDLGLMTTHYAVELEGGKSVEIWLLNECPPETLEMNSKFWERIGKPAKAVLRIEGSLLTIKSV